MDGGGNDVKCMIQGLLQGKFKIKVMFDRRLRKQERALRSTLFLTSAVFLATPPPLPKPCETKRRSHSEIRGAR